MPAPATADAVGLELTLSRRLRDLRQIASKVKRSRMKPLQVCEALIENRLVDPKIRPFFLGLPKEEKHYWIASLYALLMPPGRRRRLAAYFTPPHLAQYALDTLIDSGIKPGKDRILDPASGGAAFLVPLAARIIQEGRVRRMGQENIVRAIQSTLAGVEIEPPLADLSKALLADLFRSELGAAAANLKVPITSANTLELPRPAELYDAVVGNPPYGRIYRPTKKLLKEFRSVITDGYVNLYSLFVEQSLQWVRPGGIICLIIPISFVGGAYFAALRKRILETARILRLDLIDKRSDVFLDVLYDVCVLVLQKRGGAGRPALPASSLLMIGEPHRLLGRPDIPAEPSERVWALPDGKQQGQLFQSGLHTLEDYGYIAKAGYFVWNREQHRYRTGQKPRRNEVPLYWAHNVKANAICFPLDATHESKRIGFVKIEQHKPCIVRSDAIIVQRTSNRRQRRRLNAAIIRRSKVPGKKGFVSENHTIVIAPDPAKTQRVPLTLLCRLLNTAPVDARFRRMSGTVSVSTKALRQLPLPAAKEVRSAFKAGLDDDDAAATAYARSLRSSPFRPLDRKERKRGGP